MLIYSHAIHTPHKNFEHYRNWKFPIKKRKKNQFLYSQKNNNLEGYYKRWLTNENGIQTPWLQIGQNAAEFNETQTPEKWLAKWCHIRNLVINVLTPNEVFGSSWSGCPRNPGYITLQMLHRYSASTSRRGCLLSVPCRPSYYCHIDEEKWRSEPDLLLIIPSRKTSAGGELTDRNQRTRPLWERSGAWQGDPRSRGALGPVWNSIRNGNEHHLCLPSRQELALTALHFSLFKVTVFLPSVHLKGNIFSISRLLTLC